MICRYGKARDETPAGWTRHPMTGWQGERNRVIFVREENQMEVDIKKMHHRGAADTEVEAAEKVAPRVTGLRLRVLRHLSQFGAATGEQVAAGMDEWLYSVKPRITELSRYGLVEDTGERLMNQRKRREIVWQITQAGKEFLNG